MVQQSFRNEGLTLDTDLSLILPDYIREPLIWMCVAIMIYIPALRLYEFLKVRRSK